MGSMLVPHPVWNPPPDQVFMNFAENFQCAGVHTVLESVDNAPSTTGSGDRFSFDLFRGATDDFTEPSGLIFDTTPRSPSPGLDDLLHTLMQHEPHLEHHHPLEPTDHDWHVRDVQKELTKRQGPTLTEMDDPSMAFCGDEAFLDSMFQGWSQLTPGPSAEAVEAHELMFANFQGPHPQNLTARADTGVPGDAVGAPARCTYGAAAQEEIPSLELSMSEDRPPPPSGCHRGLRNSFSASSIFPRQEIGQDHARLPSAPLIDEHYTPPPSNQLQDSGPRISGQRSSSSPQLLSQLPHSVSTSVASSGAADPCSSSETTVDKGGWREQLKRAVRAREPALAAAEGHHTRVGFETPGTLAARLSVVVDNLASRRPPQEHPFSQESESTCQMQACSLPWSKLRNKQTLANEKVGDPSEQLAILVRERLKGVKGKQSQAKRPAISQASPPPELTRKLATHHECGAPEEDGYSRRGGKQLCRRESAASALTLGKAQEGLAFIPLDSQLMYSRSFLCVLPDLAGGPTGQVGVWDAELLKGVSSQLLDLATAYSCHDLTKVEDTREWLQMLASPVGSVPQRLSFYVLSALDARFKGTPATALAAPCLDLYRSVQRGAEPIIEYARGGLQRMYRSFQEILMTRTLIDALKGHKNVHIMVLTACSTPLWDQLFAALVSQPGGRPDRVRITIMFPDLVPEIQREFEHLGEQALRSAERVGIEAHCQQIFFVPSEFRPWESVEIEQGEALGVVTWLTMSLFPDASVLRHNPRDTFLKWLREHPLKVLTVVECDVNLNVPFFLPRFREALKGMEILLANFERTIHCESTARTRAADMCLEGLSVLDFMNCVSYEGLQRYERPERLDKWRQRLRGLGFIEQHYGSELFSAIRAATSIGSLCIVEDRGFASLQWDNIPYMFGGSWTLP